MELSGRRTFAAGVLAVALAAGRADPALPAVAPPDTDAATRPKADPGEIGAAAADIAHIKTMLPGLKPLPLRDAVALTLGADKLLELTSKIAPCDGEAYQPLSDDNAIVKVSFLGLGDRAMPTFVVYRGAGASVVRYDLTGGRALPLTLARSLIAADREQEVQLFQSMPNEDAGDRAVRLTVTENDAKVVEVGARDAETLVRKYPGAAARYLRPMLRELGMDGALFAGSAAEAYEVLALDLPADADAKAKVEALLPKLDSDASAEREAGQKALAQLGQRAANVLMTYDRGKLTPQQFAEVDAFLAGFSPLSADEAQTARASADRLASYLSLDDAALRKLAYARLRTLSPNVPAFDPDAPADDRARQVAAIETFLVPNAPAPATQPK